MRVGLYLSLIAAAFIAQSCKVAQKTEKMNIADVAIVQDDKKQVLTETSETITLKNEPFKIQFYNKAYNPEEKRFYATQIAALDSKEALESLQTGLETGETSVFSPGTGMAPAQSGQYDDFIVNNYGHHYLFFENEERKRVQKTGIKEDLLLLEFSVNSVLKEGETFQLGEDDISTLHIAILTDRNLNKTIDEGELHKIIITLK